jgi:surface antigen
MRKLIPLALSAAALLSSSTVMADPIRLNDNDEGYSRLMRWEQHLDDTIADGVRRNSLSARRAWTMQKDLDSIEAHVLQSYYESNNGIDPQTFRGYAGQLRDLGTQLGDSNWADSNVYGDGWRDDRGDDQGDRDGHNASPPDNYYRQGDYERSCHQGNAAAGTVFGAIAGGLIGGAASHGNGGAVAGGVILGGLLGNSLSRDIDCDDQRYAFDAYGASLNGDIDRDYDWRHGNNYGTFTSVREYRDGGQVCRDFRVVTYHDGQRFDRTGTACRDDNGNWNTR